MGFGDIWTCTELDMPLRSVPPRPCRLLGALAALLLRHLRGPRLPALEPTAPTKFHGERVFSLAGRWCTLSLAGGLVYDPPGEVGQVQALLCLA